LLDIWKKILQAGGARIYSMGLAFLSLILTARILGPEGRGQFVAITTWTTTLATVTCLSLGQVVLYRAAQSRDGAWLPDSYRVLVSFTGVLSLIGWGLAVLVYLTPLRTVYGGLNPLWLAVGFLALPFRIWDNYAVALFQAIGKLNSYNVFLVASSTVGIIALALLIQWLHLGLLGALAALLVGQAVLTLGGMAALHGLAQGYRLPARQACTAFAGDGLKIHLNTIGMLLIAGIDLLMLNYYCGPEETSRYQIATQLMGIIMLVPQAASLIVSSRISSLGPSKAWPIQRKIVWQSTLLMLGISTILGATSKAWLPMAFGSDYRASADLLNLLLFAGLGMTFATLMAPQWIGRGLLLQASLLTIISGIINVILNSMLMPTYGAAGATYSVLVTYGFAIVAHGAMFFYCDRERKRTVSE